MEEGLGGGGLEKRIKHRKGASMHGFKDIFSLKWTFTPNFPLHAPFLTRGPWQADLWRMGTGASGRSDPCQSDLSSSFRLDEGMEEPARW